MIARRVLVAVVVGALGGVLFAGGLDAQERAVERIADGGIAISTGGTSRIVVGPMVEPFDTIPAIFLIAELESLRATAYPAALRESGVGGVVLVGMNVDWTGLVVGTRLDRSSGLKALDDSALRVASAMHFEDGAAGPRSRPVWTSVSIRFEIAQGAE